MKTIPEFTDADIHEMMDFKQVLALTDEAHKRSRKIVRRIVTTVLITGLVGASWFTYERYSAPGTSAPSEPTTSNPQPTELQPSVVQPDTALQYVVPGRTEVAKQKPVQKPLPT